MTDYAALEHSLVDALQLARRPVAVAFLARPPAGVKAFVGSRPSSCSFWKLAAEGDVFYTVASDHHNCPVGAYTHNIPLPPDREQELPQVLTIMSDIGYIRMEEIPGVPRLPVTPSAALYAPLASTPVSPDVVIISGRPGKMMLLQEAATRAKTPSQPMLGRPTCMAIPAAFAGHAASSLGCVGNRVYTGVTDDEFYVMIAGRDLEAVVGELPTIISANSALFGYHEERLAGLTS
jgi:uncharacterized protein (DUF169 family)